MIRGWLAVCVGIVMLGTVAISDGVPEPIQEFHTVNVTVARSNTLELWDEGPVEIDASPAEEQSTTITGGLQYSLNSASVENLWKITVRAAAGADNWLTLSVSVPGGAAVGGQPVAEAVVLVTNGMKQDEADLVTGINQSGDYTADLTYTVAAVGWAVSADTFASVEVIYRLMEA